MSDSSFEIVLKGAEREVTIPLTLTIRLGSATLGQNVTPEREGTEESGEGLERLVVDADYSNRKGYDKDFLGIEVKLPTLTDEQSRNAAFFETQDPDVDDTELKYHHFSIVMNRRRQLAYYTAVNIDGAQSFRIVRTPDTWIYDPRIAQSEQIGGELYRRNHLDRGHLVRREDPVWGATEAEARQANNDTFHFTNCSPQHEQLNENTERWRGLEDMILKDARVGKQRITVFSGPLLMNDDPLYKGVRLPLAFWKIVVYRTTEAEGAALTSSAFLLWQDDLIANGLERFDPNLFQVPVSTIVEKTRLQFQYLEAYDRLKRPGGEEALRKSAESETSSLESLGEREPLFPRIEILDGSHILL